MKLTFPRAAAAAGLLAACTAAPALAAPDHSFTASSQSTKFEWEGAPQTTRGAPAYVEQREQVPCRTPARPCEDVLINVTEAGKLVIKVDGQPDSATGVDVDLYVYTSDAEGSKGESVGNGVASGPDSVTVKVAKPGYYLAQVDYYHAANGSYKGTGTFVANAEPAPAPVVGETPAPSATPAPSSAPSQPAKPATKKASCKTKAKKVKNAKKRKAAFKKCAKKAKKKKK